MWPSRGRVLKLQERMWRRVTAALSVTTCHKGCPTPSHVEELHPQKERPCHCASTPTAGDFGRAGVARIQTRRWAQVLHNGVPQEEHHVANANEPEVMGGTGGKLGTAGAAAWRSARRPRGGPAHGCRESSSPRRGGHAPRSRHALEYAAPLPARGSCAAPGNFCRLVSPQEHLGL